MVALLCSVQHRLVNIYLFLNVADKLADVLLLGVVYLLILLAVRFAGVCLMLEHGVCLVFYFFWNVDSRYFKALLLLVVLSPIGVCRDSV